MKHLLPVICLLSSLLCPLLRAAAVVELAPDLGYLRVRSIVHERVAIARALQQSSALVLDLRYTMDESNAGETLRQELSNQAAKPRLYVLVSPATPVVGVIASRPVRWLVTLGVKGSLPEPQVVVHQSSVDDRKAYDSLATGTALSDLISGKVQKDRYDEASLVQEFKGGNHDARPPAFGQSESPEAASAGNPAPLARTTDRVLQRAVHLHRTLQALKR